MLSRIWTVRSKPLGTSGPVEAGGAGLVAAGGLGAGAALDVDAGGLAGAGLDGAGLGGGGLDEEAASLLEDAKSANKWRAVCAGISTGLIVGGGIWAGAHGASLVLDQVWISKNSAGIEGRFVW